MQTEKVEVRIEPTKKRIWEAAAARNGIRLSAFVRRAADAAALGAPFLSRQEIDSLDELRDQVRRVGVNLNALLRLLYIYEDGGGRLPDHELVTAILADLQAVQREVTDFLTMKGVGHGPDA